MSAKLRTTNFDAVLASAPQDKTAAIVVGGKKKAILSVDDRYEELRRTRDMLAARLTAMNADRVPRSDPQRKAFAQRVTLIEAELKELRPLLRPKITPQAFGQAFINEAERLLPRQLFEEIRLAARGACTVATDPRDMWEPAA